MTRDEYAKQTRICFLDDRDAVASYVKTYESSELEKILAIADNFTLLMRFQNISTHQLWLIKMN